MVAKGVERFRLHPLRNSGYQLVPDPEGELVHYSDYEKLEAEHRRKEQIRESEVVEAHEHRTCHENLRRRAERQRDRANEALEEAEQRAANWKRRAESSNRSCDRARQEVLEEVRAGLATHWLAQIECDHDAEQDRPICGCSEVDLGWHPSVGAAVDHWIDHFLATFDPSPTAPPPPSDAPSVPDQFSGFTAIPCPTCGGPCKVHTADEGTSSYEEEEGER